MKGLVCAMGLALMAAGCAASPAPAGGDLSLDDLMGGGRAKGGDLQARIGKAGASPLGSEANPVRVNMPEGQRAYLRRLRCADGAQPAAERAGSYGFGPFGSIIDGYRVKCPAAAEPVVVFMDMYHPDHDETAAPAGFTLVAK
jgi:hypothetical protein